MRQNLWPNALAKLCGAALVPEEGVFDIRHGHALAVADDLIGGVFHD